MRQGCIWSPCLFKLYAEFSSVTQLCPTLCDSMDCSLLGSSVHGFSRHEYWEKKKNTGVGCHFLLQGIFPTQGSNLRLLCLLRWQADSSPLAPPGKPIHLLFKCAIISGNPPCLITLPLGTAFPRYPVEQKPRTCPKAVKGPRKHLS